MENHLTAYPEGGVQDPDENAAHIYVPEGETADLKVIVSADDESSLTYTWYEDWNEIEGRDSCTTSAIDYLKNYQFRVSDQYGNSQEWYFDVHVENNLKAYPEGEDEDTDSATVYVGSGQKAELKACVSAQEDEGLNFHWYVEEKESEDNKWFSELEEETGLSYTTEAITEDKVYKFRVEDKYGNEKEVIFTVKVNEILVGWHEEGGERYYYKEDGTRLTKGWAKDGSTWYWMDESGKITKSKWVQSAGKWYYMDSSGVMATGRQQIGGKWYYFNSSGVMTTGWQKIGGKWYYMNSSGQMLTGTQVIGGKTYVFNSSGVWIK